MISFVAIYHHSDGFGSKVFQAASWTDAVAAWVKLHPPGAILRSISEETGCDFQLNRRSASLDICHRPRFANQSV